MPSLGGSLEKVVVRGLLFMFSLLAKKKDIEAIPIYHLRTVGQERAQITFGSLLRDDRESFLAPLDCHGINPGGQSTSRFMQAAGGIPFPVAVGTE